MPLLQEQASAPIVGETVPNSRGWLLVCFHLRVSLKARVGETVPNSRGWLLSTILPPPCSSLFVGETVPNSRGWLLGLTRVLGAVLTV